MDLVKDAFISHIDPYTQYRGLHEKYRYKLAELAQEFAQEARCLPSIYEEHFLKLCQEDRILKSYEIWINVYGRMQPQDVPLMCTKVHKVCTCYKHDMCFEIALSSSELQCDYELSVEYDQEIVNYDKFTVLFGPPTRTWEDFKCYTEDSKKDKVRNALYSAIHAVFFL